MSCTKTSRQPSQRQNHFSERRKRRAKRAPAQTRQRRGSGPSSAMARPTSAGAMERESAVGSAAGSRAGGMRSRGYSSRPPGRKREVTAEARRTRSTEEEEPWIASFCSSELRALRASAVSLGTRTSTQSRRTPLRGEALEELLRRAELGLVTVLLGPLPRRARRRGTARGLAPAHELRRKGLGAGPHVHEGPVHARVDQLAAAVGRARDHGQARGEGLERRVRERVVARRQDVHVRGGVQLLGRERAADEARPPREPERGRAGLEARAGRVEAGHDQARLRARGEHLREGLQHEVEPLARVARAEEQHRALAGREAELAPLRRPGARAQARVEAREVDAVVDHGHALAREPVACLDVAPHHRGVRDHVRLGPRERALLDPHRQGVLPGAAPEPAVAWRQRGAVRELEVRALAAAAEAQHVLGPGAPEPDHEVVGGTREVALDRVREAPRAPGPAQREPVQALEAHARVRRRRVRAAHHRDLVPARGEEPGQAVQVALRTAALRVAQVRQGEAHAATMPRERRGVPPGARVWHAHPAASMTLRALSIAHVDAERGFAGGEEQVFLLVQGLRARGHRNVLLAPPGSAAAREAARLGLETSAVPMRSDLDLPAVPRLQRALRAAGVDLVHLHTARATWLGGLAARREGLVALTTRRQDRPLARSWRTRLVYGRLVQRAVAISPAVAAHLAAGGVERARLVTIPSAVDPARLASTRPRATVRAELGLHPQDFVVLTLAAL